MKFENRNIGVFDLLSVQMLADEVFDAGRLRQETLRMVERGSRRLVIDLGSVDYLYSDSINALVALNRRMLESSGRMGILVPSPKVYDILVRAGLENIMRLYRSEADLLNDSRELMRQSSAWTRPAELLSAASASQMISANVVSPKNPNDTRETNPPGQRIPRKRVGSRVELRPRRRGGRSMDQEQPTSEFHLPPSLPNTAGESTTLRMLSQESSAFDNPNLPSPSKSAHFPPPAPQEPSVFQAPEPPREESYRGTDPWLRTMPSLPSEPPKDARRPAPPEAASSSFLPKVDPAASASHTNDPQSNFPTALHWDHLPDTTPREPARSPKAKENDPEDWAATQPMQTISLASLPSEPPAAEIKPAVPDIKSVIFYDDPPIKPPVPSGAPTAPQNPIETKPLVWSDPKVATPPKPAAEPTRAPAPAPSTPALDRWFASSTPAKPATPPPAPTPEAQKPPATPSGSGASPTSARSTGRFEPSPLDPWLSGSTSPAKPAAASSPTSSRAPDAPVEFSGRSPAKAEPSGFDEWFAGTTPVAPKPQPAPKPTPISAPTASAETSPPTTPPTTPRAPQATVDPSVRSASKPAPSGLDDWFAGTPVPAVKSSPAPAPVAPPPTPKAAPAPAAPIPPPAAAPQTPAPDLWFAGAASTAKPTPPPIQAPPVAREDRPLSNAAATAPLDAWMTPGPKAPSVDFPPSNAIGGTMWLDPKPPRKTLSAPKDPTAYLDLDDLTGEEKRNKKPLVIALIGLAVVVVVALVLIFSSTSSSAPEVPNQTTLEPATAPAVDSVATPPVEAPPAEEPTQSPSAAKSKPVAKETAKPAVATPTAPPVEDHAPVKIFVTSRPSGAVVLLDGTRAGTTPCEITFKRAGKLEFTLAGYRQQSKDIDPEETRGTVNVQLFADGGAGGSLGRIYITSAPTGAEIVVEGKNLGKTPRLVELPVGSQKVTVRSGTQTKTRSLEIQSGTNTAEFFSL